MNEITTLEEFKRIKNGDPNHIIVILDTANENKSHFVGCEYINEDNFQEKVLENNRKNGHYFYYRTLNEAGQADHPKVSPCGRCNANLLRYH